MAKIRENKNFKVALDKFLYIFGKNADYNEEIIRFYSGEKILAGRGVCTDNKFNFKIFNDENIVDGILEENNGLIEINYVVTKYDDKESFIEGRFRTKNDENHRSPLFMNKMYFHVPEANGKVIIETLNGLFKFYVHGHNIYHKTDYFEHKNKSRSIEISNSRKDRSLSLNIVKSDGKIISESVPIVDIDTKGLEQIEIGMGKFLRAYDNRYFEVLKQIKEHFDYFGEDLFESFLFEILYFLNENQFKSLFNVDKNAYQRKRKSS